MEINTGEVRQPEITWWDEDSVSRGEAARGKLKRCFRALSRSPPRAWFEPMIGWTTLSFERRNIPNQGEAKFTFPFFSSFFFYHSTPFFSESPF